MFKKYALVSLLAFSQAAYSSTPEENQNDDPSYLFLRTTIGVTAGALGGICIQRSARAQAQANKARTKSYSRAFSTLEANVFKVAGAGSLLISALSLPVAPLSIESSVIDVLFWSIPIKALAALSIAAISGTANTVRSSIAEHTATPLGQNLEIALSSNHA